MTNPHLRQQWIQALLSVRHRQTSDYALRIKDATGFKFCAFGVLLDLIDATKWFVAETYEAEGYRVYWWGDERDGLGMPPASVLRDVGLDANGAMEIAAMNDNGVPFSDIAGHLAATA